MTAIVLPRDVRRRVDALWDRLWSSGISNPLVAIDHLSTVLLLRRLDDLGHRSAPSLWDEVTALVAAGDPDPVVELMTRVQREFGIGGGFGSSAMWRDLTTLGHVMAEIGDLDIGERNTDILGDVYEFMLDHLSTAGHFGQFRTPRHLIQFVVRAVDPRPGEVVVDPAAGTAGFLIAAHEHRGGGPGEVYLGHEVDATVARVARTNLLLHGMAGGHVEVADSLLHTQPDADVIVANPPFAGAVVADRVASYECGTLKTELLFVELSMRRLRPGGRAGVVVPTGVLTSPSSAAVWIRRRLVESNRLRAVVELPPGVFRPYTGIRTAVLLWSNEPPGGDVLMIRVDHDGFSLDDRREPTGHDDLPAALALLAGRDASLSHARVAPADLAAHHHNLSPSRHVVDLEPPDWAARRTPLAESLPRVRQAVRAVEAELDHLEGLLP